jgi:cell division protein FtsZ
MTININIPEKINMIPKITVLGVGGAGGNAVNNMISLQLQGVNFVVANTDAQALKNSKAGQVIQLGEKLTKGLGAGSSPDVGSKAALESAQDIVDNLLDSNMVFITAGMGGGTGTGAAPEIAKLCKENGVLTVGVVTKPFHFEGSYRMKAAESGVAAMQKNVDTLIVVPNQNLFHKANEKTTFAEAFSMVDDILYCGIKAITDLMTMPGLINLDFADIKTIMGGMGKAMMGTGEASGDKRALEAAECAISNPLLDNASMKGAKGVLINISGGLDMTLFEADEAAQRIRDEVDPDANIIFGSTFDKNLDGKIRVSVVATGIDFENYGNVDKALAFQSLENKFMSNKTGDVNKAVNNKNSDVSDKYSENNSRLKAKIARDESFLDVNKSFIPPQVVDPEQLQLHEEDNKVVTINDNNAETKSEEKQEGFHFTEGESKDEAKKIDDNIYLESFLNSNSIDSEIQDESTELENNLDSKNAKSSGLKGSLGNFFGLFKDEKKANNKHNDAIDEVSSADSESDDLVFNDDVLNVPTFIRDNDSKKNVS